MSEDLMFEQMACADICAIALKLQPSNVLHEPERWQAWLKERYREENLSAPIWTKTMPEVGIYKSAFVLAWHYLKQTAQGQPSFATSALMQEEVFVKFTRAVIIWIFCITYVRESELIDS